MFWLQEQIFVPVKYEKFSGFEDASSILGKWSSGLDESVFNFTNFPGDSFWAHDVVTPGHHCTSDYFRCHDGYCVPLWCRCDSVPQCHDGSDEIGCQKPHPSETSHCEIIFWLAAVELWMLHPWWVCHHSLIHTASSACDFVKLSTVYWSLSLIMYQYAASYS